MSFEALAHFYDFQISDLPPEWLPLTYLYDPDLPLLPILYFHELDPSLSEGQRAGERDRVFGFVHSIGYNRSTGIVTVSLAVSKDLSLNTNVRFVSVVEGAARSRLGLDNPVRLQDINGAFSNNLAKANNLLLELWQQIVVSSFGGKLPFGRCWDPIFGLARFIASWNSDGGRKGELIQLHAYLAAFGERIQVGGGIHADFYLLPTWKEFRETSNPLALFRKFSALIAATQFFATSFTNVISLGTFSYSQFTLTRLRSATGQNFSRLDTTALISLMNLAPDRSVIKTALYDNYSAFNRGPGRSILSLLMHYDLRHGNWDPSGLTQQDCVSQYTGLSSSYQSPKVMQLYAQQCFGALPVLPIDNWIETFVKGPLALSGPKKSFHASVFGSSPIWGKVERLIWMAAQARKVHSSVAENILWCIRYGGPDKQMRFANPFSCKVCDQHIRAVCPAYKSIAALPVTFNQGGTPNNGFDIRTSANSNHSVGQTFVACQGSSSYDEYTPKDRPMSFSAFPSPMHHGTASMTVTQFLATY